MLATAHVNLKSRLLGPGHSQERVHEVAEADAQPDLQWLTVNANPAHVGTSERINTLQGSKPACRT